MERNRPHELFKISWPAHLHAKVGRRNVVTGRCEEIDLGTTTITVTNM